MGNAWQLQFVLAWQLQFVLAWQLQLSRHGNCSCPDMATAAVPGWQLQLFSHGNYILSTMLLLLIDHLQLHFFNGLTCVWRRWQVHGCRLMPRAAWRFCIFPDITRESFAILCKFIFHVHTSMFHFSYALPWFATLASWSWLPIHLSVLAPCDWTSYGAPLSVFWS